MAYTIIHFAPETRGRIDAFFNGPAQGVNLCLDASARSARIEALEARTDVAPADMGLIRDRTVAPGFRDAFWI